MCVCFQSPRLKLKKMSFLLVHFGNHFGWRKRKNEMYVLWNNSSLAEWIENLKLPLNSPWKIDLKGIFKCLKSWLLFFIKIHQNKDGRVRLHVLLNNLSLAEPMSNLIVPEDSSWNFEYFRPITCWKSPKIKSQKSLVMTSTSPENSKVWQRSLELSFHFQISNFKWKLWDLGAMAFDGTGTIGFLVFQSFIWNDDIMEKWKFFREIPTKV